MAEAYLAYKTAKALVRAGKAVYNWWQYKLSLRQNNLQANMAGSDSISLPWIGEPNSTARCRRRDGTPKQKRRYGSNGEPLQDIDYDHDHGAGTPHVHDWDGRRRLPGREPNENDGDLDFEAD